MGSVREMTGRTGLVRLDRGEAESRDADSSASATQPEGDSALHVRESIPDPEVLAYAGRRRFSAVYETRIVREADACTKLGELGSQLRREVLHSCHLTEWRRLYRSGAQAALADD